MVSWKAGIRVWQDHPQLSLVLLQQLQRGRIDGRIRMLDNQPSAARAPTDEVAQVITQIEERAPPTWSAPEGAMARLAGMGPLDRVTPAA